MIIAVSGKIGSGKDTFAQIAMNHQPSMNWEVKKWAGKLKQVATLMTGVDVRLWEDQEFKKKTLDPWGMTAREFLQKLGTDAMRDGLHKDVWVNALMADYKHKFVTIPRPDLVEEVEALGFKDPATMIPVYPNWIITDTRFPNEAEAVRNMGFPVVRIVRSAFTDNHPSEVALDNYGRFDFTINNTGSMAEFEVKVKEVLDKILSVSKLS